MTQYFILQPGAYGVLPGELTTADNMEMHFFSTTQNALLFLGLTSENANYYAQLYMVDFNTGNAAPTNVSYRLEMSQQ